MSTKISFSKELIAGGTIFFAMAYILFVNPNILATTGIPHQTVFIATCISAAIGCLLVGGLANYPIAVAPGMGLNVYFALVLVGQFGFSWQLALAAYFMAALLFLVVVIFGLSVYLTKAIPHCLHNGILIGLGFLLMILALQNLELITFAHGNIVFHTFNVKAISLALIGLASIIVLDYLQISAAIILGVLITTLLSFLFTNAPFYGVITLPSGTGFYLPDMHFTQLLNYRGLSVVISLFFVLFFDCAGTFIGLMHQAKLAIEPKPLRRALFSTSVASGLGSVMGTSGLTSYAESAAGIKAGGRTGLTAITVGMLFLLALFFSPLAKSIPAYATAPSLFYVGLLMVKGLHKVNWRDANLFIPTSLTALVIPTTFSISDGIAAGILSFIVLALVGRRKAFLSTPLLVLGGLFLIYLAMKLF